MNENYIPRYPLIKIDTHKITGNARKIIRLCARRNISAYPVLKAVCGFEPAIKAVLAAQPEGIFDSCIRRLDLIKKYCAGLDLKIGLIKLMSENDHEFFRSYLSEIDYFFVSDIFQLKAIAKSKPGAKVLLAVDSGDLREGIPLDDFDSFLRMALKIKKINIYGAATNHACFSGVVPSFDILKKFVNIIETSEKKYGFEFSMISGGNSSLLGLIHENKAGARINNVRIGEAIFLGMDVLTKRPIDWLEQDVFRVAAQVIECREKDSILYGVRTQNAFNELIDFGGMRPGVKRRRALLDLGRKHFYLNGIKPLEKGVYVLGASSDYLIADVADCARRISCGDILEFSLDYAALMSAMRGAGTQINCS